MDDGYTSDIADNDTMFGLQYPAWMSCCGKYNHTVIERYPFSSLVDILNELGSSQSTVVEGLRSYVEEPYETVVTMSYEGCCCEYMRVYRCAAYALLHPY